MHVTDLSGKETIARVTGRLQLHLRRKGRFGRAAESDWKAAEALVGEGQGAEGAEGHWESAGVQGPAREVLGSSVGARSGRTGLGNCCQFATTYTFSLSTSRLETTQRLRADLSDIKQVE